MPTVTVVDHRPFARAGVRVMLEDAGFEVLVSASPDQAPTAIAQQPSDVLVVGGDGHVELFGLTTEAARSSIRVIALVDDHDIDLLRAAVDAGCDGVLASSATAEELVAMMQAVCDGQQLVHHAALATLMNDHRTEAEVANPLSAREYEVLERAARGLTTDQIADDLGIASSTAKTHLGRVFEKLGANDRAHAVAIGFRRQILT